MNEQEPIKVWIARDEDGVFMFPEKPVMKRQKWYCRVGISQMEVEKLPKWFQPNLNPGECKQYEITFRETD